MSLYAYIYRPPKPTNNQTNQHRWTEIGNSGIFRPEMLRPMGLPEVGTTPLVL